VNAVSSVEPARQDEPDTVGSPAIPTKKPDLALDANDHDGQTL